MMKYTYADSCTANHSQCKMTGMLQTVLPHRKKESVQSTNFSLKICFSYSIPSSTTLENFRAKPIQMKHVSGPRPAHQIAYSSCEPIGPILALLLDCTLVNEFTSGPCTTSASLVHDVFLGRQSIICGSSATSLNLAVPNANDEAVPLGRIPGYQEQRKTKRCQKRNQRISLVDTVQSSISARLV